MQHVYQKYPYSYSKRSSQVNMVYLLAGPGILSASGEWTQLSRVTLGSPCSVARDHVRHRKIMNPSFSAARLRAFLPIFQRIGCKVNVIVHSDLSSTADASIMQLTVLLKANMDDSGEEVDVMFNKWISSATLDIIGEGYQSLSSLLLPQTDLNEFTAAFNYDYGALDDRGSPLYKSYDNLM